MDRGNTRFNTSEAAKFLTKYACHSNCLPYPDKKVTEGNLRQKRKRNTGPAWAEDENGIYYEKRELVKAVGCEYAEWSYDREVNLIEVFFGSSLCEVPFIILFDEISKSYSEMGEGVHSIYHMDAIERFGFHLPMVEVLLDSRAKMRAQMAFGQTVMYATNRAAIGLAIHIKHYVPDIDIIDVPERLQLYIDNLVTRQ